VVFGDWFCGCWELVASWDKREVKGFHTFDGFWFAIYFIHYSQCCNIYTNNLILKTSNSK
jgi:hypothetical protein